MSAISLTEIISSLEESKIDCQSDISKEWSTAEEKSLLSCDLAQLKIAISILKELKESGSEQFFRGCMRKE